MHVQSLLVASIFAVAAVAHGTTREFCDKPPVVDDKDLDLASYANGTWFQLYASGSALLFSSDTCTTANYTLRANGSVAVLNCALDTVGASKPFCQRAEASPRVNATKTAELSVAFPAVPSSPFNPGKYSIAALLGDAADGYDAAAVYQCDASTGVYNSGFFIIARSICNPEQVLASVKVPLRAAGYEVDRVNFVKTFHDKCVYFDGEAGFDVRTFGPPTGAGNGASGPPPGVVTGTPPPGVAGGTPPPGVAPVAA